MKTGRNTKKISEGFFSETQGFFLETTTQINTNTDESHIKNLDDANHGCFVRRDGKIFWNTNTPGHNNRYGMEKSRSICKEGLTCGVAGSCYVSGFDASSKCCVPLNCASDVKNAAFCYAALSFGFCSSDKVSEVCCHTCKYSRCRGQKDCCTETSPCIEFDGECTADNQCIGDSNRCHKGACPAAYPESQFKASMKCCSKTTPSPDLVAPPVEIETSSLLFGFVYKNEHVWGSCPDENGVIQGFTWKIVTMTLDHERTPTTDGIYKVHCINGPPLRSGSTCKELDWKKTFDRDLMWGKCPTGSFLKAIYRSNGKFLRYLDKGVCCKPNNQPIEEVYTSHDCQEVHDMLKEVGTYKCPARFALAGLQRNDGARQHLGVRGLSTFWCCPFKRTSAEVVTPVTSVDDTTEARALRNITEAQGNVAHTALHNITEAQGKVAHTALRNITEAQGKVSRTALHNNITEAQGNVTHTALHNITEAQGKVAHTALHNKYAASSNAARSPSPNYLKKENTSNKTLVH